MSALFFSWRELLDVCGGQWLIAPEADACSAGVTSVFDDSRAIVPGALFVAIVGDLTDGHRYLEQALDKQAAAACLEKVPEEKLLHRMRAEGTPCLLVDNGLVAFQRLARAHRHKFPDLIELAITGSSGKTSSKELCAAILEQRWPRQVLKTIGNTNNHYGVPRNLLRLTPETAVAVIEMGSNHPGEIAGLVSLTSPRVGLVCNIGQAHLEFFHDLNGVANEKGDLLAGTNSDGWAIFPYEAVGHEILLAKAGKRRCLTFGKSPEADVRSEYLGWQKGLFRVRLSWRQGGVVREFDWQLGGAHQALNAAGAAAASTALGLTADEIIRGLQNCQLPDQRMEVLEKDGLFWCNDAYNANPDSAQAALEWFAEISSQAEKRALILGDMRELGENAAQAHLELLQKASAALPQARIIAVGELMEKPAKALKIEHFPDTNSAKVALKGEFSPGTWILLKASNGLQLYRFPES
jgi:UDP-N-acetylmuramoyl-tripeptide--D-alanyl-D-alanine ligase